MTVPLQPFPILPSADEVRAFEAECGFDLPTDYKAFLLGYNGGVVPRPVDSADDPGELGFYAEPAPSPGAKPKSPEPAFWSVALFHGLLRRPGQYGDLRGIYLVLRDDWDHPGELLPVASMTNNGKYFLCTAGAQRGRVLVAGEAYRDRRDAGQPVTPADYHCVADRFDDLLAGLAWRRY